MVREFRIATSVASGEASLNLGFAKAHAAKIGEVDPLPNQQFVTG
jgi:hypothetical protein